VKPALRQKLDAYRDERAFELFEIADKLEQHGFTLDAGPVREAARQCRSAIRTARGDVPDAGREFWGYEITDLRILLAAQRHCRPRAATMDQVSGSLTVTVEEYVPQDLDEVGAGFAHLRRLDTDFHFDAELVVDGVSQIVRAAWHLDTHLYVGTESDAAHPRFHFQVGGESLDDLDSAIRGVFVPEAPRLPCAPLDGILAIDFILSHYCGRDWQALRDLDPSYVYLRKAPMRRYWQPYYQALSEGIAQLDDDPSGGAASVLVPSVFA
jgi:hypothetical protein